MTEVRREEKIFRTPVVAASGVPNWITFRTSQGENMARKRMGKSNTALKGNFFMSARNSSAITASRKRYCGSGRVRLAKPSEIAEMAVSREVCRPTEAPPVRGAKRSLIKNNTERRRKKVEMVSVRRVTFQSIPRGSNAISPAEIYHTHFLSVRRLAICQTKTGITEERAICRRISGMLEFATASDPARSRGYSG